MKKTILSAAFILAFASSSFAAQLRFIKLSDHCYYFPSKEGENVSAVVTEEGVLIIDPPDESDLPAVIEALKRLTLRAVRWVAFTDYHFSRNAGARYFAEQGAMLLASAPLYTLLPSSTAGDSKEAPAVKTDPNEKGFGKILSFPWIVFPNQMRLFPANLEIRIFAIKNKTRTGGDVMVFIPADKVLFVGDFYESSRYPDIDKDAQGSALGWIDGMKQAIDSIPLLKSAFAPVKPETKPEQEKTPEEGIVVASAHGAPSNLRQMKDQREVVLKLRQDLTRSFKAGRTGEIFLASPDANPYRNYGNLDSFVEQLLEDLQK